jgi:hypothetical protein
MYGNQGLVYLAGERAGSQFGQELALRRVAARRFWQLFAGGFWRRVRARLGQQPAELKSLKQATEGMVLESSRQLGADAVPLAQIKGSENKSADFDGQFRPLKPFVRERWIGLAAAYLLGKTLPPVELIKVGQDYYVRDGHHRISVARAFGQQEIDAQITLWQVTAAS